MFADNVKEKQKTGGRKPKKAIDSFFDTTDTGDDDDFVASFEQLQLSKPTLKVCRASEARIHGVVHVQAITAAGFSEPTPIQGRSIPVALAGR